MNSFASPISNRRGVLEIGERLTEAPSDRLTNTAFAQELAAQLGLADAAHWVDLAHTLCLAKLGVIPNESARALVAALLELQAKPDSFAPMPEYGDLYTNREAWIAARTQSVGWLGVARARREALTTAFHMTLCENLLGLTDALAAAIDVLAHISLRHKNSLMPDYTYLQAAQPTTFGHYLQSFAWPMLRDIDRALALHARVDQCPAGIGSSNGSVTMQNRRALAERLGFREPVLHARDAMWQADIALEAAAVASTAAVNLDRLAEDLMIFASCEFGFIELADRHARASKIMPQKRNPFALGFVRATANRLIGAQAALAAAARTPSGQMDNRFFAYHAAPEAIGSARDATYLIAECVGALKFNESRALSALNDRAACATDLAERMMAATGVNFRAAHGIVGRLIQDLQSNGRELSSLSLDDVQQALRAEGAACAGMTAQLLAAALDPAACVASRSDIGCAAPEQVAELAEQLTRAASERRRETELARRRREAALERLKAEAESFARGEQ